MNRMLVLYMTVLLLYVSQKSSCTKISQCGRNEDEPPEDCITERSLALGSYRTVEDFDRCAPYFMPKVSRQYYLATAGRCMTYKENILGYQRLRILPRMLRDVSNINLSVTVLGHPIDIPIGASPTALQTLASDLGEVETVRAISDAGTVMILSSYSGTLLEVVAEAAPRARKWMQLYIFPDRRYTINLIQRAEANGFQALVVTVDSPVEESIASRGNIFRQNPSNTTCVNLLVLKGKLPHVNNPSLTFEDLLWVKRNTKLPIVVKGILTPDDAVKALLHGASAILVSNHGGRQLDFGPATIDVLPGIVDAVRSMNSGAEVYVDGGIRNGFDVFKAIALGARAVFIGRPIAWGLAAGGKAGVAKVFDILKTELKQTMMLSGTPTLDRIQRYMVTDDGRCR